MAVATFVQPNSAAGGQDAATYKAALDAAVKVLSRQAAAFAVHAQSTPNMTVQVDAGYVFNGTTLTEVAAQNSGTIPAPVTNPRIDRVVVNASTGAYTVLIGTEAASPTPPAITPGWLPVAKIALTTGTTSITNSIITDERAQVLHANLLALAGLSLIADRLPYANGAGTMALTMFTAQARALLDDGTALEQLNTIGAGLPDLTADGSPDAAADYLMTWDASAGALRKVPLSAVAGDGEYRSVQVFAASGTYTKPAGLKRVRVTVVGGGGGGSGSLAGTSGGGGGGGAGGTAVETISASLIGTTETVTIGAGGAGGAAGANNGSAGGTSSFGAHCSATGGAGGLYNSFAGAAGGYGSGGSWSQRGGPGNGGRTGYYGARGGNSFLGGGGQETHGTAADAGYGNSGGGGGGGAVDTTRAGGAGATGLVLVEEFF